jgi:hypothetical protein
LSWRSRFDAFRHRWVLTPEEKRVIVFVLLAFALGLATKHYRETHPLLPRKIDKKYLRASDSVSLTEASEEVADEK